MTTVELRKATTIDRRAVEQALRRSLRSELGIPSRLKQAMGHSLFAGGKRLRPLFVIWTWAAIEPTAVGPRLDRNQVMGIACALEMLHTYSLIHDDLPAMDDDAWRRGKPTCHVAFDEATAILAGDGLQALAFSLLARNADHLAGPVVDLVGKAVGPAGMVGGQQLDLDGEHTAPTAAMITRIHTGKTARLLMAAAGAGALAAGADKQQLESITGAFRQLGLAFQGADDVLDVTASGATLGKTPGKDAASDKATWVKIEGVERAIGRNERLGRRGMRELDAALPVGPARDRVLGLANLLWDRSY